MTSADSLNSTDDRQSTSGVIAVAVVMVCLFVVIGFVVYWGAAPVAPRSKACTAAMERAMDSRRLSSREEIDASTAMLRACNVH
jgi:hypothetical protein